MKNGGAFSQDGPGERLYVQADDAAQAKTPVRVVPRAFHHFGKTAGHKFLVVHFIEMAHDRQLYTTAHRLDEIAYEAGAAAPQTMDNPHARFDAAGDALPFQRVIEKGVPVIESHIERSLCLTLFACEEILRGGMEVAGPEKAGPFGLQHENTAVGIGRQPGQRSKIGLQRPDEGMLVLHLGEEESRGVGRRLSFIEAAYFAGDIRVDVTAAGLNGGGFPLACMRIPARHDSGALPRQCAEGALAPTHAGSETLQGTEHLQGDAALAAAQHAFLQADFPAVFPRQDEMVDHEGGVNPCCCA